MFKLTRRSLLVGIPAWPLLAQQDPTFVSDVSVVNVFATVHDKHGALLKDLQRDDFTLLEDGREQRIRYFSRNSDLPLTLGLLVDTSASQRGVLEAERRASYKFFEQVLREYKDLAFVIHFDHEVELLQDLTSSKKKLEAALTDLAVPSAGAMRRRQPGSTGPRRNGVGTSLYDSVELASDELMKRQSGRKALVLLTDGVDFGSKLTLIDGIASAQRADTLVYAVRFFDREPMMRVQQQRPGFGGGRRGGGRRMPKQAQSRPDGKKVLQRLSRETGGGYFDVDKNNTIEKTFARIEEELRNQYSIGYTSDQKDGPAYRKITLSAKQKNLVVQARDGYFAGQPM